MLKRSGGVGRSGGGRGGGAGQGARGLLLLGRGIGGDGGDECRLVYPAHSRAAAMNRAEQENLYGQAAAVAAGVAGSLASFRSRESLDCVTDIFAHAHKSAAHPNSYQNNGRVFGNHWYVLRL